MSGCLVQDLYVQIYKTVTTTRPENCLEHILWNCKTKEATNLALANNRQTTQQDRNDYRENENKRHGRLQHLLSRSWVPLVTQVLPRTFAADM